MVSTLIETLPTSDSFVQGTAFKGIFLTLSISFFLGNLGTFFAAGIVVKQWVATHLLKKHLPLALSSLELFGLETFSGKQ